MINEGQDTSANKTHLFNWLSDMTVQMAQGVCVCVCLFSVCARCSRGFHLFTRARVCALIAYVYICMHRGKWPIHVPAISFLTSLLHGYKPDVR